MCNTVRIKLGYLLLFGNRNKNSLDGEPSNYLRGSSTLKIYSRATWLKDTSS